MGDRIQYVIRFDDLCPTMNWQMWDRIVEVLDEHKIKPILAVIPDNRDSKFLCSKEMLDFWERIRSYQNKNWMIALHGYNHKYTNKNSGMMGIAANSEFAGYSYDVQNEKIKRGLEIFSREGVVAEAFIAPSHSFDKTTLQVLKDCGINLISDGHINMPYKYLDMMWLPCQKWERFDATKPGIYTVCFHPNFWTEQFFQMFKKNIEENCSNIVDPHEIQTYNQISFIQMLQNFYKSSMFRFKRIVKRILYGQNRKK